MNTSRLRALERQAQRGHKPEMRVLYERDNETVFDAEGREFFGEQAARQHYADDIVIVVDEACYGL